VGLFKVVSYLLVYRSPIRQWLATGLTVLLGLPGTAYTSAGFYARKVAIKYRLSPTDPNTLSLLKMVVSF
jgi:hypothetical protein